MSTDPSTAAFARLDAAAGEPQPLAAARPRDLAELAAALARVEALLASDGEGFEGSAAIERIADVAFVLHERDVERSLCDALDAAVREIDAGDALRRASMQRSREAAALLREVSRAFDQMVAMATAEQPHSAAPVAEAIASWNGVEAVSEGHDAEAATEDELTLPAGLFDAAVPEDDEFALAVAALAQALPEGAGAAPSVSHDDIVAPASSSEMLTHSEDAADEETIEVFAAGEATVSHFSTEEDLHEPMSDGQPVADADVAADVDADVDLGTAVSEPAVLPEAFFKEAAAVPDRLEIDDGQPDDGQPDDGQPVAALDAELGTEAGENAALPDPFFDEAAAMPVGFAINESLELQTTTGAVTDHDQEPSVTELTESEPVDAAPLAAYDEAPAQDEQSAAFSELPPEPVASQTAVDPNEDPGDLFESVFVSQPPSVTAVPVVMAPPQSEDEPARASIPLDDLWPAPAASEAVAAETQPASASALRLPPVAPVHAAPPPPSDPLAPIRALSEEELIALFS